MNNNFYRVIFNKVRGQLIAVAENVAARGKTAGTGSSAAMGKRIVVALRPLQFALLLMFGAVASLPQAANGQVVVDQSAPAQQQPTLLNAANGVPLVNIQTPSAAGVSRNVYTQFDVDHQGLILNNSRTNVQTQLGGWVQGNPWLAGGTAKVILNEVNSSNPSVLQGYVETAGDRAQVVIANPAGITCSGCGFLNASRVTLTTGTVVVNSGSLDGYRVQGGVVAVEGGGMDTSGADYTDLIARAVQVNANIWANQLRVTAGANQVDAANTTAAPISGSGVVPAYAVDVAQLGGMYAGKIVLVGTEAGVGVRNAGEIGASAGDLVVTAAGRLENKGTLYAQGNTGITTSSDVVNQGVIAAQGDVAISGIGANSQIDNSGNLIRSGGTLSLIADTVLNNGTQGTDQGIEGGAVSIQARQIDNGYGAIRADQALSLTASDVLDNNGGLVSSSGTLDITDTVPSAKTLAVINTNGTLIAGQTLAVDSATLTGDGSVESLGDLSVNLLGGYTHTGTMQANGNLQFSTAGNLDNQSAILAGGSLHVAAENVVNEETGELSGQATTVSVSDTLTNRGLVDGGETRVSADTVENLGPGRIYGDHLAILANTLNNLFDSDTTATIAARDRLDLGVGTLTNNSHSAILSMGDMAIGGTLDENWQATGQATRIENDSADIEAMGNLNLTAAQVNNINNDFYASLQQIGSPQAITEYQGSGSPNRYTPGTPDVYVYNDESDHLHTPEGNYETWLQYNYTRTIQETVINYSEPAQITAGGDMQLTADNVLNDKSHIIAGGALNGTIGSLQNVEVSGQHIVTDVGSVTTYWRDHQKGRDSTGSSSTGYAPAATIQDISLGPSEFLAHTTPTTSGTYVASLGANSLNATVSGITVPNSGLFRVAASPETTTLIESDPRFTDYRAWLSSDYMLQALSIDPSTIQKRLGDGFYEQKLLREQVAQLTGSRFLSGFNNDETEYQALMDAGVTYAKEYHLTPGIALTEAQVAQLTSDIVWLVAKTVTLPDGTTTQALVPQIYVAVREGDLSASGALIAGDSINMNVAGDLTNGGTIAGRTVVALDAENVQNLEGRIRGDTVAVVAHNDLNDLGGTISAGSTLVAQAGHDLNVVSTTNSQQNGQGSVTNLARVAGLYVTGSEGNLVATAGNDIDVNAGQVTSAGNASLSAGHDIALGTVTTTEAHNIVWDSQNVRKDSTSEEQGSSLQATGDITLTAGNDLNARAAAITSSQGAATLAAGNDVALVAGQTQQSVDETHHHTEKGFLSSKSVTTRDTVDRTTALGSSVDGSSVAVSAGHDLSVTGSAVASDNGTALTAGNDLAVAAAVETNHETHLIEEHASGLLNSSGSIGFTIGSRDQSTDQKDTTYTAAASTVGSTQGNVSLQAGNAYSQTASNVVAPQGDIDIAAKQVAIQDVLQSERSTTETKFHQSGLTVALSSPVISAIQTVQQMDKASKQTSNSRLKALAVATDALAAKNAVDAVKSDSSAGGGINISITVGSSSSQSEQTRTTQTVAGSTVAAGGNVSIAATGAGRDSNLTVQGSDITAGHDATLKADGAINLLAAANTDDQHSTSSSNSAGAGIAISYGSGGAAFGFTANASGSRGKTDGTDVAWSNTHVTAGNLLTLDSGGDTTLKGAVASGNQVVASVGGNLDIESLQDTSTYASRDQSLGGSVTVGFGFSASANYGQSKIDSDYASVLEQSGIKARDGGFQVDVQGNTDLKGAVIESSQAAVDAGRNTLATAGLTTSEIQNHANYDASSFSLGGGYTSANYSLAKADGSRATPSPSGVGTDQKGKAQTGSQTPGTALPSLNGFSATIPVALSASGDDASTTQSGVSGATVTIGGQTSDTRTQALTGSDGKAVARVTTEQDTSGALKNNFDLNEIQTGFQITQAFVQQVGTFLDNRAKEAESAKAELEKAKRQGADQATLDQLQAQVDAADKWAPGGSYRQILTALTAAAGGDVTGGASRFAQAAAVNYLQSLTVTEAKRLADSLMQDGQPTPASEATRAALQALVGCAGAAANGQSCGAAAQGAAASVVLNNVIESVSGKDVAHLSPTEKEAQKNLVETLVAGIAGAEGTNVATAANAAAMETENNALVKKADVGNALTVCKTNRGCIKDVLESYDHNNRTQLENCKVQGNCDRLITQYQAGIEALIAHRSEIGEAEFQTSLKDNLRGMAEAVANGQDFANNQARAQAFTQTLLDVLPVTGSLSSAYELITGKTAVTDEDASRGLAALGIVMGIAPGGKASVKLIEGLYDAEKVAKTTRLAENSLRGRVFQSDALKALGIDENTQRITVALAGGKNVTVIPDALGHTIIEVKDVKILSNSDQFRGYLETSIQQGKQIDLIVSPRTQSISGPLKALIEESQGTIKVFDPVTKTFGPYLGN